MIKRVFFALIAGLFIFSFIQFVSAGSWDLVTDLKTFDSNITRIVEMKTLDSKLYVLSYYYPANRGGSDPINMMVTEYDGTNWRKLPLIYDVPAGGMMVPLGMEVVNNLLYVATFNDTSPTADRLLKYYNSTTNSWGSAYMPPYNSGTTNTFINTVLSPPWLNNLFTISNKLFVTGGNVATYDASTFKIYNPVTKSWTTSSGYSGYFGNELIKAITTNSSDIYAFTSDFVSSGRVFKSNDGANSWSQIGSLGCDSTGIAGACFASLVIFNGNLYAGTSNGPFRQYLGSGSWQQVPLINNIVDLESSANKLFIISNPVSRFVQEYDGTNVINSSCTEGLGIRKLEAYNGEMYAGTDNWYDTKIYKYNSSSATCGSPPVIPTPAPCTPANQTILSLYATTNSHAAFFNNTFQDSNYNQGICYNDIFGVEYTGSNPWNCNGNNKVVRLSGNTNAHGENATLNTAGYGTLCYGDLTCTVRTSACVGNEALVVSLSGNTNAHLASYVAGLAGYGYNVCCSNGHVINQGSITTQWLNQAGTPISTASLNQRVILYANSNGNPVSLVNVSIYKKSGNVNLANFNNVQFANGEIKLNWVIDYAGMGDGDKIYFNITGSGNRIMGNELTVNVVPCENAMLRINISKPLPGIYMTNVPLEIDAFRDINYPSEWNGLQLNWTISPDGFSTTTPLNFWYTFTTPGTKTIHLKAKNACGAEVDREVSIELMDGSTGNHVYAYISEPRSYEVFPFVGDSISILYNGTKTCAYHSEVNLSGGCPTINELYGDCPSNIANNPNCTIIQSPTADYSGIYFNWSGLFRSGVTPVKEGYGNVSGNNILGDSETSTSVNDRSYRLFASYAGQTSFMEADFTVGVCINNGRSRTWADESGLYIGKFATTNELVSLNGPFSPTACNLGAGKTCCPSIAPVCDSLRGCIASNDTTPIGSTCALRSGTNKSFCESATVSARSCSNYATGSASCTWQSSTSLCLEQTSWWNINTGALLNVVTKSYRNISECNVDLGVWEVELNTTCTNETIATQCLDDECGSSIVQLPCGKPAFQLPFFGWAQAMIALAIVLMVYLFLRKK